MSRAIELNSFHQLLERTRAHSFPLSKRARLFPLAAYRRLAPPQLARGHTQPLQGGCFGVACVFSQGKRPAGNQIHADLYCKPEGLSPDGGLSYPTSTKPHQTREPRGLSPSGGKPAIKLLSSERSARIARSPGSRGTAPCASHEARRRMAVWARQQTGSRARPASREALRRAAVKPRPSRMSPYTPARIARSPGSRGTAPCARPVAERR